MIQRKSIALADVSWLFARQYLARRNEAQNTGATAALREIGRLRQTFGHVVCCLDAPPYSRKTLYAEYKAKRDEQTPEYYQHKEWLIGQLEQEGFPMAEAQGYESDDIIATLVQRYKLVCPELVIVSNDKDLYQLVGPGVRLMIPTGLTRPEKWIGEAEVIEKTKGCPPGKIVDWIALVGDDGDNLPGCKGCGPVNASKLLEEYASVDGIYLAMHEQPVQTNKFIGKALWAKLKAARQAVLMCRELARLNSNAPIDAGALLGEPEEHETAVESASEPVSFEPEHDEWDPFDNTTTNDNDNHLPAEATWMKDASEQARADAEERSAIEAETHHAEREHRTATRPEPAPSRRGPNIHERINRVMGDIRAVTKSERNQFAKFNYAGYENVNEAVRDLFVKHGITQTVDMSQCTVTADATVICKVEVTWQCTDDPASCVKSGMFAIQPTQTNAKTPTAQQVGQALSYATKNVIFKQLMLVGENEQDSDATAPPRDERPRERPPAPQARPPARAPAPAQRPAPNPAPRYADRRGP